MNVTSSKQQQDFEPLAKPVLSVSQKTFLRFIVSNFDVNDPKPFHLFFNHVNLYLSNGSVSGSVGLHQFELQELKQTAFITLYQSEKGDGWVKPTELAIATVREWDPPRSGTLPVGPAARGKQTGFSADIKEHQKVYEIVNEIGRKKWRSDLPLACTLFHARAITFPDTWKEEGISSWADLAATAITKKSFRGRRLCDWIRYRVDYIEDAKKTLG